jgi:hypothetical protein
LTLSKLNGDIILPRIERLRSFINYDQKFEHLYAQNDPLKGGSQYLQAKIVSAREALEELTKKGATGPHSGPTPGPTESGKHLP